MVELTFLIDLSFLLEKDAMNAFGIYAKTVVPALARAQRCLLRLFQSKMYIVHTVSPITTTDLIPLLTNAQ
jgi:hypothetical protein